MQGLIMARKVDEKEPLVRRTANFFAPLNYIALAIILVAVVAALMN